MPAPLREPRRAWLAILIGWALSIVGSLALAALSRTFAPDLPTPEFPMKGPTAFFLLVVFAPLLETLIMAGFLSLFLRFLPPAAAILLSAAGWGVAHSLEAVGWGLVIWWPFLIFSTLYRRLAPARLLGRRRRRRHHPRAAESRSGLGRRVRLVIRCAGAASRPYSQ